MNDKSTLARQRVVYFACLAVCLVLLIAGEAGWMDSGLCAPDSQAAYVLNIVSIAATLAALPAALRLRGATRSVLVALCAAVTLVCNYLTMSPYAVLCLGIVAFALLYSFPHETKDGRPQADGHEAGTKAGPDNN